MDSANSGRLSANHWRCAAKDGSRSKVAWPSVVVAYSGIRPTMERTRTGMRSPPATWKTS